MDNICGLMKTIQADRVVKAIVDGVEEYAEIAARADLDPCELVEHAVVLDRAIQLMSGFYKYGHENMKPAGLPPPPNPYLVKEKVVGEQAPEYFAFEAVQRSGMDRERSIWTCGQLGIDAETAATAVDNVCIPWREANGWRTYAQLNSNGKYVLMDKPPVKLKRHIERILAALV
jgi:hypothetical protein